MRGLESKAEDSSYRSVLSMVRALNGLATYHGIRGTIDVIDSAPAGWRSIRAAIDFRAWSMRIQAHTLLSSPIPSKRAFGTTANPAASLVCLSPQWAPRALDVLREIETRSGSDSSHWDSLRLVPFVLYLTDNSDDRRRNDLPDPYRSIVDNWDDSTELAQALTAVCDYHVKNMNDTGDDWRPEFDRSPFDLLPCEVILVRRLRNSLGLTTPSIDHPLATHLGSEWPIEDQAEHPVLVTVEKAFNDCFG